ncbi:MAG TPA: cytochrome c maturation protein CcmE [Bryobacteraceae bacterium]|nr:cytochrome c maturation protein CcmE [Bryobacteraceae bacterium]
MKPYAKFGILVVAILGTLGWLAAGGINETKTYYMEIKEVKALGSGAVTKGRLRVGGDVQKDSIIRDGKEVRFTLIQNDLKLPVIYTGTEPLPDTFRDGSQALADGKMRPDGVLQASRIQAKCASKYEGKPSYKVKESVNKAGV